MYYVGRSLPLRYLLQGCLPSIKKTATRQPWLYLAAVLDLFSRQVIGWSMGTRMDKELALNALVMAVWRRQPKQTVMVHSDQGSQFSSYDWQDFLKAHNLPQSMSQRGNCHDNAVAESFFQLLNEYSQQSGQRFSRQVGHPLARQTGHLFSYPDIKLHHGVSDAKARLRPYKTPDPISHVFSFGT